MNTTSVFTARAVLTVAVSHGRVGPAVTVEIRHHRGPAEWGGGSACRDVDRMWEVCPGQRARLPLRQEQERRSHGEDAHPPQQATSALLAPFGSKSLSELGIDTVQTRFPVKTAADHTS